MSARPRSQLLGIALSLILTAGGCKCGDPCASLPGVQPDHPGACSESSPCGERYGCVPLGDQQCCVLQPRACSTGAACCPGQVCGADGTCADRYVPCDQDADCDAAAGQRCTEWSFAGTTSKRCQLPRCTEGACPDGGSCFAGVCHRALPCGGACPAGEACEAQTGRCQQAMCPASCGPGTIASFTDATNLWDACRLSGAQCACLELPPLSSPDVGRFSSVARDSSGRLLVAAYDGTYGDLILVDAGARIDVDGVPASGAVRYGLRGPRGGITDPGPDVGRYTDLAVGNGRVYVSYQDVGAKDLKLAVRDASGAWTRFRVDGAVTDTGWYGSLALDPNGRPAIAYFQRGGDAGFDPASCPGTPPSGPKERITALRFARANRVDPASAADFTFVTIACAARAPLPCEGCAGVCADTGTGPACQTAATGCSGCDPFAETCVQAGASPACAAKAEPPNLLTIPDGVGLFPSLAFQGPVAEIAFQQRTGGKGALYGVTVSATGSASAPVLLDGSGDTGHDPDLAVGPDGQLWIAYHDGARHALVLWRAPAFAPGVAPETIDAGLGTPGDQAWVGRGASLAFLADGTPWVLSQDASHGALKSAVRRGSTWSASVLSPSGGFFPHALGGAAPQWVHTRLKATSVLGEARLESSVESAAAAP